MGVIVQEQVQLNVALQTEIVRFTVLGIQRAIRDVEESTNEPERLSGGIGAPSFFVSFPCFKAVIYCSLRALIMN